MFDWFINQSIIVKTILASLFTFTLTGMGAGVVFLFKKVNKNLMDLMLSLSAGIMLAATFFSLLEPSITLADSLHLKSYLIISFGILSGCFLLYLGDLIFESTTKKHKNDVNKYKRIFMIIFSITLHNIPEGLAIGVAFGSLKYNIPGASLFAAISLAIGIGIQNFPEGAAISLSLRREGVSRLKSFVYGMSSGLVEPVAAILGAILVLKTRYILPFFLSFAAGAMLYVIIKELIPESQENSNKNLMTIFTILGFILMMILDVTLG